MKDLDVDHEEFLDSNEAFALPNLGFKFFVGNSLVGEHDPTNVDARQATLTGGLDDTLEKIHRVRTRYQTAHGEAIDRLTGRLDELTAELETQLAIEKGSWMTPVADAAEETFAWTTNIPEVILEGGFDIVIGNPPYEGQSQQSYIGELARFYDEKYDFYETIPRMRHDLYQKFNVRGWELTREGGVLSYITSDTFYTIGSKETTRNLLQQNRLHDLLRANPNTFDATVEPAIFTLRKRSKTHDYRFSYVDASETAIGEYRSLVGNLVEISGEASTSEDGPTALELPPPSRGYSVPVGLYRNTLRSAFFEPTETNLYLHDSFLSDIKDTSERWSDAIMDSTHIEDNLSEIYSEHVDQLSPGDTSIMGLLTQGGQGLSTGNNREYLAYLEGTRGVRKVKERNGDDFAYVTKNEEGFGQSRLCRVITEDHIADIDSLTGAEREYGIERDTDEVWVPIEKGFTEDETYYKQSDQYINWSREFVEKIDETGYIRNRDVFFREGVYAVLGGFARIRVRYSNDKVIENGNLFFPHTRKITAEYLTGVLNSAVCVHIFENFINSEGVSTQNIRLIPVKMPTDAERQAVEGLIEEAIRIRKGESERSIEELQSEIDETIAEIYGVSMEALENTDG